jgi:ABC-2 type transport system permease protein
MPEWLYLATSPFAHVNPYFQPTPGTYAGMAVVAGAFIAVGAATLRLRDLIRT